jgi:hypothetical protein
MLAEQGVLTAMTDTMMALRAHARGGPEQLVYEAAPVPVPGPGEALVAVHAAAITFAELSWDPSWTTRDGRDRTPVIPSHEVSGTVAGLGPGPGADGLTVGEEVYGLIDFDRDGAAAEYVTVPAAHLAARPRSVSDEEAATLPLAALTAWQALVDHAALKPGERVLVQGGAGGVGSYAVRSSRCATEGRPSRAQPSRIPQAKQSCSSANAQRSTAHPRGRGGRPEPADFMITKEKHAHRMFFFRDHAERRERNQAASHDVRRNPSGAAATAARPRYGLRPTPPMPGTSPGSGNRVASGRHLFSSTTPGEISLRSSKNPVSCAGLRG